MKLIRQEDVSPTIIVDFHGVGLVIPIKYRGGYLAVSIDGIVMAFMQIPELVSGKYWTCRNAGSNSMKIAEVESDIDFRKSVIKIK